jgi:DMSO/TMAO reductase YedYZ molybdopterin-dependent catalytic subunit
VSRRSKGLRGRLQALIRVTLAGAALAGIGMAAACGGGHTALSPSPAASGPIILTVVGDGGSRSFTFPQLKALPAYTGYAGIKSSTGVITPPVKYTGVRLRDLTALVGGITRANGVTIVAKDGYGMTFSYRQVMQNGFTTYDPATGDEEPPDGELHVLIAYAREGKMLAEDEGPLRLAVAEDTPGQVVDGHWAIKWLDRVSVTKASARWEVQLQGATAATMDKASYVNCASPGCHGSGWVDQQGKRWEGVPLYLVCGLVDGGRKHDAGAFDAALARRGYKIQIESADGRVVTLDSRDVAGKKSIVLSSKVDGGELPDAYFPLRLVGPGLSESQKIARIARIVVRVK